MSKRKIKIKHFVQTLLEIIEDKRDMHFSEFTYCFLIFILYSQYAGYIFDTFEPKPLREPSITYWAHWMEYSPGTFLLYLTGNDSLTLFVFCCLQVFVYSTISYIIAVTLIRVYYPRIIARLKNFTRFYNMILQYFFTFYLWIFYIPMTEIHAGTAVCGGNSFFTKFRDPANCPDKPYYQRILGPIGVINTFWIGTTLNLFYISYEFQERNYLKRRFRFNLIIQLLGRTMFCTLYYINLDNILIVKTCFAQLLGLSACYDFFRNLPFKNKTVCIGYGTITLIYEFTMIIFGCWELTEFYPEFNLFLMWVMSFPIAFGVIYAYWSHNYYFSLSLKPTEMKGAHFMVDMQLEELYLLGLQSESNKRSKLILMGMLSNHIRTCNDKNCIFNQDPSYCNFLDANFQIDMNKLIRIINNFFTVYLRQDVFRKEIEEQEHLSLKYCSFLANFQDNPVRAYYELKTLLYKDKKKDSKSKRSMFFKLISQIISKNIESLIEVNLDNSGFRSGLRSRLASEDFYSISLQELTSFQNNFITKFNKILASKRDFWEKLSNGFHSLDQFSAVSMKLIKNLKKVKKEFQEECSHIEQIGGKDHIIYLKLNSIFYSVLINDNFWCHKYELKIVEQHKRDSIMNKDVISSLTIINGQSVHLMASLLHETGKIFSEKSELLSRFFGYNKGEFEGITNIGSLMPDPIAKIHPELLKSFRQHGKSRTIRTSRFVFCKEKGGTIFPAKIFYNFSYDFFSNFCMSAVLTRFKTSHSYIFFDEKTIMGGLSKEIADIFSIDENFLSMLYEETVLLLIPALLEQLNQEEIQIMMQENKAGEVQLLSNQKMLMFVPLNMRNYLDNFRNFKEGHKAVLSSNDWKAISRSMKKFNNLFNNDRVRSKRYSVTVSLRVQNYNSSKSDIHTFYTVDVSDINVEDKDLESESTINMSTYQSTSTERFKIMDSTGNKDLEEKEEHQESSIDIPVEEIPEVPQIDIKVIKDVQVQKTKSYADEKTRTNSGSFKEISKELAAEMKDSKTHQLSVKIKEHSSREPLKFKQHSGKITEREESAVIGEETFGRLGSSSNKLSAPMIKKDEEIIEKLQGRPSKNKSIYHHHNELMRMNSEAVNDESEKSEHELHIGSKREDSQILNEKEDNNDYGKILETTKRRRESETEDQAKDFASQRSTSSYVQNFGSNMVRDFVNNQRSPKILRNIFVMSLIQIIFFLSVNLIYIILINLRLEALQTNVSRIFIPNSLLNAFSNILYQSNTLYLESEGVLNVDEGIVLNNNKVNQYSYNKLSNFMENYIGDFPELYQDSEIITFFIDSEKKTERFLYDQFYQLSTILAYEHSKSDSYNNDYYLFYRSNFALNLKYLKNMEETQIKNEKENKDNTIFFYIILSIIGLIFVLFLQAINLPNIFKAYAYSEKILLLVSRINEADLREEISALDSHLEKTSSAMNEYLAHDFLNRDKRLNPTVSKKALTKSSAKASNSYMSSRIINQKLKTFRPLLLILISIFGIFIYFIIIFCFLILIKNSLGAAVDIKTEASLLFRSLEVSKTVPRLLITSNRVSETKFMDPDDRKTLLNILKTSINQLERFSSEGENIFSLNSNIGDNDRENLKKIYGGNGCEIFSILQCENMTQNPFRFGLSGYISLVLQNERQALPFYENPDLISDSFFQDYLAKEKVLQNINNIIVSDFIIDKMKETLTYTSEKLISNLYTILVALFLVGGGICSIMQIAVLRVIYEKLQSKLLNTRMLLLMIPQKKLFEETTLYLLKNLENI